MVAFTSSLLSLSPSLTILPIFLAFLITSSCAHIGLTSSPALILFAKLYANNSPLTSPFHSIATLPVMLAINPLTVTDPSLSGSLTSLLVFTILITGYRLFLVIVALQPESIGLINPPFITNILPILSELFVRFVTNIPGITA